MRGRKPKPSHMKVVTGNPGRRPLNENEPKPEIKIPTCPGHLTSSARTEWRRISRELESLELLSQIDRAALAAYCQAYGRWVEAENGLKRLEAQARQDFKAAKERGDETAILKSGMTQKTGNGIEIQHPLIGIANSALDLMRKFLVEFGMTPSARSRISVGGKKKNADKAESYFAK